MALLLSALVAITLVAMAWELHRKNKAIQALSARAALCDHLAMELRDTWDHLPRFVPIPPGWSVIAEELGLGLPRLIREIALSGLDPMRDPVPREMFFPGAIDFARIDHEVAKLGDATLTELWRTRRMQDLATILRLALFKTWQPGFDLSAFYREPELPSDALHAG